MEKLFYRTKRNYVPAKGEDYTGIPSQTVIGEAQTIQQIVARYQKTGLIQKNEPVYFDVEDIESINSMFAPGQVDLTDMEELSARVDYLKDALKRAEKAKKVAEKEEEEKNQLKLDLEQPEKPEVE